MLSDEERKALARQAGELTGEVFPSSESRWLRKYTELVWSRAQLEFVVQPGVQKVIEERGRAGA